MNYIVLDLEWNSAFHKKEGRFVNEIIQIGAVKLDENFEMLDTFKVYIKSALSKKLSVRVIELTGISNNQMSSGTSFENAVLKYNKWAGKDTVTMTWSDSDLYALVENTRLFLDDRDMLRIEKYLDLQSYIQDVLRSRGHEIKNQISLANAANLLDVSTSDFALHNAVDDSLLAAKLLKETFDAKRFNFFIKDTTDPKFYKRLLFKSYYINNISDERINKSHLKFNCIHCKNQLVRKNRWRFKNNWFRADLYCKKCETRFRGMVSFKQNFDKVAVKKRMLPLTAENEVKNADMQQLSEKM